MTPAEVGVNAGALALAFAVVKFAEVTIKAFLTKKSESKPVQTNDGLLDVLRSVDRSLSRMVDNSERQLEALKHIEEEISSHSTSLAIAARDREMLQKSIDKLQDHIDRVAQ